MLVFRRCKWCHCLKPDQNTNVNFIALQMCMSEQQRTFMSDRTGYSLPAPWSTAVLYSLILSGIFHPFYGTRRILLLCSRQPPPNTMTSLMNPLHVYTSCKFKTNFNIILPLNAWLFQILSPSQPPPLPPAGISTRVI